MTLFARARLRHPLFPNLAPVLAPDAAGLSTAIAGAFDELVQAASAGARVRRAIFPLQPASDPVLSVSERDTLWELFEVPVYVLVLDTQGRIVAFECEAREGLHLEGAIGLPGLVETSPCDCGFPGPRWFSADVKRRCA